jgi:hypothetical protein
MKGKVFSRGGYQWEVSGHKERENEGYVLHPYMKIGK